MGVQQWLPVCLVVLVFLQGVSCVWHDAPYEDDSHNVRARYTDDTSLYCNDSRVGGLDYQVVKWILPRLDIMYPGDEFCFNTLDGWACWNVSSDGLDMDIIMVQDEHFGLYYCEVEDISTNELYIVKRGLNYKGAYMGSTWAKYDVATIWSVTSAIVFGIVCGGLGVMYIKMYPDVEEEEEEEGKDEKASVAGDKKEGYENAAFTASNGDMNVSKTTIPNDDATTYM